MKIIELLDGSTWDLETLKSRMHDDDFYYGNLSKNALSSSACKLLLTSPKTYHYVTKYGSEDSDAFSVGRLVHLMALEPHRVEEYNVIEVQSKNAKAWQEAKGQRNICTRKEMDEAQRIADALLRNEYFLSMIQGCEFEQPAIGMIEGMPFRAKADIIADGFLADLKTTNDLRAFQYSSAKKYGYDVQAFIYTRLFGIPIDKFYFIAIDKSSLDVGIYSITPEFVAEGERKTLEAIQLYKQFFILGEDLDSYTIFGEL